MARRHPHPGLSDSVADEIAYVLAHAEVTHAVVQDQEQVDKFLSVIDQLPTLVHILYDKDRGLRDYDHTRLHAIDNVIAEGARASRQDDTARCSIANWNPASGADLAIILYTSGTTGRPKGVMLSHDNVVKAAEIGCRFRQAERPGRNPRLSADCLGRRPYLLYAQGILAGFCVNCPESPETVVEDRREIGSTYVFAPPRIFENLLTLTMVRMEDASAIKRKMFRYFLGLANRVGEKILNGDSSVAAS